VHLVQVLVEEDGDLEERPRCEPRNAHATVALEAEERAKSFLAPSRRTERDQEVREVRPGVPEPVRRPRRHDEDVAGAQGAGSAPDPEAKLPEDALEALPLARVHMRRDESSGADEELAGDAPCRPLAEDDALAGHRVPDRVYAFVDRLI
jgi:hypothetical protein